jgi:hypothetical protein
MERMWKEVDVAYFEVLSHHLHERAEENNVKLDVGREVGLLKFEQKAS